jgi:hypothetical protein
MSPYLLQHAGNPVDWWEWGEEAMSQVGRRDVPMPLRSQAVAFDAGGVYVGRMFVAAVLVSCRYYVVSFGSSFGVMWVGRPRPIP